MQYSLGETLNLTIVAILIVFAILLVIMFGMMLIGKLFGAEEEPIETTMQRRIDKEPALDLSSAELFKTNKNARVAVLTAMIKASKKNQDKKYSIEKIEKTENRG